MDKKEYIVAILSLNNEVFIIDIVALKFKTKINLLGKITILVEYLNDTIVFLFKFVTKISDYNNNNYAI